MNMANEEPVLASSCCNYTGQLLMCIHLLYEEKHLLHEVIKVISAIMLLVININLRIISASSLTEINLFCRLKISTHC